MENFDVVQALARTALAGNPEAITAQVQRLAERLAESGQPVEAKSLRALVARSRKKQAVEPVNFRPSDVLAPSKGLQKLGPTTALPVDRESGAPLCEVFMVNRDADMPVLPEQAQLAFDSLVREWRHEEELARLALPVSRSLLIYGPPGTGKTTLARAIAVTLGRPAVVARLDGLISSLLGNTARNLGALFDFCNRYECVLVLDEFDAVAKIRDDANEVGEIKRVVNALLQNLDKRTQFGLTIAATNHERLLDIAIWRRFEHQIYLGMPDANARLEITRALLRSGEPSDSLAWIVAHATAGRSGADVRSLSVAFLKVSVLTQEPTQSPVEMLRVAARATGAKGVDELNLDDRQLAARVHNAFASMTQQDLANAFGKDRKTIARWIATSEGVDS